MKIKLVVLVLLLFASFGFVEASGIRITPHRIEKNVDPGDVVEAYVSVTNTYTSPQEFYSYLGDFGPRGEAGDIILYPAGTRDEISIASWVDISPGPFHMQPGERKDIRVNFRVPDDIGPGGYYGAIIFGPEPPKADPVEGGAVVTMAHQAGVLALLNVTGGATEDARVREFSVDKNFYSTPFDVNFRVRIENLGNIHIKPAGNIRIDNMLGERVDSVKVNYQGGNILPGGTRRFNSVWRGDLGFGRYTANLVLTFGTPPAEGGLGMRTITATSTFWIFPWDIIIPSLFGLVLFISLLYLGFKFYGRKTLERAMKEAGVKKTSPKKKSRLEITFFALLFLSLIGLIASLFIL